MNRWLLIALSFACATLLSVYGAARSKDTGDGDAVSQAERVIPVKVFSLKGYSASEAPSFPGRVEAGDSAELAFRVPGEMLSLKVQMGEDVQKGDLLAELDPTDYRLNLDARQAEFDLAKLEADRATKLYAQRLISEDEYDTTRTRLATSRARLEQAREQLSFCKLVAPFTGSIAFTYAMPSEVVSAQQPVISLQDNSSMEIHFNLPLQYQPLLRMEEKASFSVTFELMPWVRFDALYKEVGMQPDPGTYSYPLTLLAQSPPDFSARPGMPVTVRLHHPSLLRTRWILPREALIQSSADGIQVWRIDPATMTVHRASVELDEEGALRAGLNPGDRIVAAGVDRLQDGQRVRPWVREGGL